MVTRRDVQSLALVIIVILALLIQNPFRLLGQVQVMPGDVLVGNGSSKIDIYRELSYVGTILTSDSLVYQVIGLCFSTRQTKLFAVCTYGTISSRITEFDGQGHRLDEIWGQTGNLNSRSESPMCCSPDADGNLFVGTYGYDSGQASVIQYDANGNSLRTFQPPTETKSYRSVEIAQDQRTLYYVDGYLVKRYDIQTGSALPDFTTVPLSVGSCMQVRLRRGGEVFVISTNAITRYSSTGAMIRGYEASFYLLDRPADRRSAPFLSAGFSTDHESLWALIGQSGIDPSRIVKLDIETGRLIDFKDVNAYSCLTVAGEFTAARTQCSDGIDNDGNGKIDYPDDPNCESNADNREASCFNLFGRYVCLMRVQWNLLYAFAVIAVGGGVWWLIRRRRARS